MSGRLAGARVAIIEDDVMLREALAVYLLERGGRVVTYGSAEEAGDAVSGGGFDLVVSDYMLPGENGLSFLRRVREASENVGIVLMADFLRKDVRRETLPPWVDSFLTKPFSASEFEAVLRGTLAGKGTGNETINEPT